MSLRAGRGPEGVSVLLRDGGRVLLVQRGSGGLFPHTWTLPGDELRAGETPEVAALRVVEEQLGSATAHVRRLRALPQPSPFRDERGPDTLVEVVSWTGEPTAAQARAEWFTIDSLADIRIFREARDVLRDVDRATPLAVVT